MTQKKCQTTKTLMDDISEIQKDIDKIMENIKKVEDKAFEKMKKIIIDCEGKTGRKLMHPKLSPEFDISKVREETGTLRNSMRELGKHVKENHNFDSGEAFVKWAKPYIVEGGRCK